MYSLFLTQTTKNEIPFPLQIMILMTCLVLPYAIHRFTGKSIFDWFRSMTLISRIADKHGYKEKGNTANNKTASSRTKAAGSKSTAKKEPRRKLLASPAGQTGVDTGSVRNDLTKFLSELLAFVRKKNMFVIMPGSVNSGNETATFSALIVTRRCVVGIITCVSSGTVTIRESSRTWIRKEGNTTREFPNPISENASNVRILKKSMEAIGLGYVPVETAEVFTSPVTFSGGKVQTTFTAKEFFDHLSSDQYQKGDLDPKEIGHKLNLLVKRGKKRK